jgi:murein DD-endopeptidase MepM/ murein hydrolase activator NlpD
MIGLILYISILATSVPAWMLEELAVKATTLAPVKEMAAEYSKVGLLPYIPCRYPIKEAARVSSRYGQRIDPITNKQKFHAGIDYACELATAIHATAAGTITYVGRRGGYGKCVEIQHRYGFKTIYAHLSEYYVLEGMAINAGKVIGFVGTTGRSTGYHLHYEVRKNNRPIEPLFFSWSKQE